MSPQDGLYEDGQDDNGHFVVANPRPRIVREPLDDEEEDAPPTTIMALVPIPRPTPRGTIGAARRALQQLLETDWPTILRARYEEEHGGDDEERPGPQTRTKEEINRNREVARLMDGLERADKVLGRWCV